MHRLILSEYLGRCGLALHQAIYLRTDTFLAPCISQVISTDEGELEHVTQFDLRLGGKICMLVTRTLNHRRMLVEKSWSANTTSRCNFSPELAVQLRAAEPVLRIQDVVW